MLKFLLGKELNEKIADAVGSTISEKVSKAIDDKNKISSEESKLNLEQEKLTLEREKFDFNKKESKDKLDLENEKLTFERDQKLRLEFEKLDFERIHRNYSYRYPTDIAAKSRIDSAHLRGKYGILSALIITGVTYGYFKYKEEALKKKDGNIEDKLLKKNEVYAKKTQLIDLSLDQQEAGDSCLRQALKDPFVKKEEIENVINLCKSKSVMYSTCLEKIKEIEPQIKELERELETKTPKGGI